MLLANKARTAVTLAGIVLSFALLTAVLTSASSLLHFMMEWETDKNGDYHGVIYECGEEQKETLTSLDQVTETVSLGIVGIGAIDEEERDGASAKYYLLVASADEAFIDTMRIKLYEGRFPENDGEIILPRSAANKSFSGEIGEEITLKLGSRLNQDGSLISHQEPVAWQLDGDGNQSISETFRKESSKKYRVTGYYEDPGFVRFEDPCYLVLTGETKTQQQDLYFKASDIDTAVEILNTCFSDCAVSYNEDMLRYMGETNADIRNLVYAMCGILAVIIAAAAIVLIYNSFSISVGERTRQFGLFRSVGATRFQMMVSVFMEAIILAVCAIPLGILTGCLGVILVFRYLQPSFESLMSVNASIGVKVEFYTEPVYLVISAAAGLLTILISAAVPAIRAARISPMVAIRQNQDIKEPKRHMRRSLKKGLAGNLLGAGGLLAHRNIRRNKKSYRVISFSLAISLFLFLGGGGFVFYMEQSIQSLYGDTQYDFWFRDNQDEAVTYSEAERLRLSSAVKEVAVVRKYNMRIDGPTSMLTPQGMYYVCQSAPHTEQEERFSMFLPTYYVDETFYEQYLLSIGLDPQAYLREENPKALVLNSARGVVYQGATHDQRRFFQGSVLKENETRLQSMIWCVKRIPEASGPSSYYFSASGITYHCGTEKKSWEQTLTLEEGRFLFPYELGAFVTESEYPFWADSYGPALLLPESQWDPSLVMDTGNRPLNGYLLAADEERAAELLFELQDEYGQDFSHYQVSQGMKQELGMIRIIRVMLMCFIVLVMLISIANIVNTISTSVRLRTREYAMIKAVGIGKRTLLCYIITENINYVLRGLVIGCLMGLAANWVEFDRMEDSIYSDQMWPVGLYVIAAAGMAVVFAFAVWYTWSKVRKGNICEELRRENL